MRIFIALLFDKQHKDSIYNIENEVKEISETGNFTSINNLHLTLKYIGETDKLRLDEIKSKLSEIRFNSFTYQTNNVKCFKKSKSKIIAYLGVENNKNLTTLFEEIIIKLNELGYDYLNEVYTPHITLGRQISILEDESIYNIKCEQMTINANRISVMESKRVNNNLVYIELFKIPLL